MTASSSPKPAPSSSSIASTSGSASTPTAPSIPSHKKFTFPTSLTTKAESDALLDHLIPKLRANARPEHDPSSFHIAWERYQHAIDAMNETLIWLTPHRHRPKIYARVRFHFTRDLVSRLEAHIKYWSQVKTQTSIRERHLSINPDTTGLHPD